VICRLDPYLGLLFSHIPTLPLHDPQPDFAIQ
jgi:hypothetical protein